MTDRPLSPERLLSEEPVSPCSPPRTQHRSRYVIALAVLLFAATVAGQVLVRPIVGLADNGDFGRVLCSVGLRPCEQNRYPLRSFPRYYAWEPAQRGKCFPTSELLFVAAALACHSATSRSGLFDIAFVGAVHGAAYVAVFGLLCGLIGRSGGRLRWLFYFVCVVVLSDVAYVAYFNSFYAESATLIFLLLAMVLAVRIALGTCECYHAKWELVALAAVSVLFVLAKLQNALLGPVLAVIVYKLSRSRYAGEESERRSLGRLGALLGALVLVVSVSYWHLYTLFPMGIRNVNVYDSVFFQIIRTSPTPVADLKELGLDESFATHKGTHAWSPGVTEQVYNEVYERVGERGIVRFYLRHPGRFLGLMLRGGRYAFVMRPGYLGNFDHDALRGMLRRRPAARRGQDESLHSDSANLLKLPPPYRSESFAVYSSAKERLFGGKQWPFVAFWLVNLAVLVARRFALDRSQADRAVTFIHGSVLVMAALQFATVTMGAGELDIVKHLFVFGITCDMCFLFIAGYCLLGRRC